MILRNPNRTQEGWEYAEKRIRIKMLLLVVSLFVYCPF